LTQLRRNAAIRIAGISVILALLTSITSWLVAREKAEVGVVSLVTEEAHRILLDRKAIDLSSDDAKINASKAAQILSDTLFDIAEIHSPNGEKLAESTSFNGSQIKPFLPSHHSSKYMTSYYEIILLPRDQWVLRVFIPLIDRSLGGVVTGYIEGIRVIPDRQKHEILNSSLTTSLMVSLATLICGVVVYPVVYAFSIDSENKTKEMLASNLSMMDVLGRAIAKRDSATGSHNYRVAWVAANIADRMSISDSEIESLILGSFLHDVGKIGIPDAILLKPGKLTESELVIMRTHVQQGIDIVDGMTWLDGAKDVVGGHHEKWNGTGYPNRLAGKSIPLNARIFAVADVFDALCSKRPYKESMDFKSVMALMITESGSHFDPDVIEAFIPISESIFERFFGENEDDARALLEERISRHFGM